MASILCSIISDVNFNGRVRLMHAEHAYVNEFSDMIRTEEVFVN